MAKIILNVKRLNSFPRTGRKSRMFVQPLLFILVLEALEGKIKQKKKRNKMHGVQNRRYIKLSFVDKMIVIIGYITNLQKNIK